MFTNEFGDKHLDLNALRLFVAVADAKNFSATAKKLGLTKWSVSRSISGLEKAMGVPLLHRTTRSITLSPAGTALYEHVAPLISSINHYVASEMTESLGEPAGEVRITAPHDLGFTFLADAISQFTAKYRAIRVNIFLTGHKSFTIGDYDIALRLGPPKLKDSSLVVKFAGRMSAHFFASPAYLAEHGTPSVPDDLADHEWVVLRGYPPLHIEGPDGPVFIKPHGRICADNEFFVLAAIRSGAGVGILTTFLAQNDIDAGRLVRVLPDYHTAVTHLYIVRPYTRQVPRRVTLLTNFLFEYIKAHPLAHIIE